MVGTNCDTPCICICVATVFPRSQTLFGNALPGKLGFPTNVIVFVVRHGVNTECRRHTLLHFVSKLTTSSIRSTMMYHCDSIKRCIVSLQDRDFRSFQNFGSLERHDYNLAANLNFLFPSLKPRILESFIQYLRYR